jgi:hypothetical protein
MKTKSIFINDIRKYIYILFGKIIYLTRRATDSITDVQSSMSDLSITSSISAMFSSSISFLHLNIQSLVPKLDLTSAEYADFDTLSFSESWFNDIINSSIIYGHFYWGFQFPPYISWVLLGGI